MTPLDIQLQQIRDLAARHYPDDEAQRNAWLVEKLSERIRELCAKSMALTVRADGTESAIEKAARAYVNACRKETSNSGLNAKLQALLVAVDGTGVSDAG